MMLAQQLSDHHLLTFTLNEQLFGVPVLQVNSVLGTQKITETAMTPLSVAGVMNLRGRIVTVVNVRHCLGQPSVEDADMCMSVVVEHDGELFSLIIDKVGDVLDLRQDTFEHTPATLDGAWRSVSSGIHKLEDKVLVVLDIGRLLDLAGGKKES